MRGAEIREAFARVWARPWLVAALALTNIGVSVVMTAPLSAMLAMLLDKRPAAAAMAAGNDGLWMEFLTAHTEVATVASVALVAGVVVYGLLSWVLDGGVLAALAFDDERRARGAGAVLGESGARASRMLTIGLFGALAAYDPAAARRHRLRHRARRHQRPHLPADAADVGGHARASPPSPGRRRRSPSTTRAAYRSTTRNTRSWRLRRARRGHALHPPRRDPAAPRVHARRLARRRRRLLAHRPAPLVRVFLTFLRLLTLVARVMITMTTLTAAARITRP